MAKKPIKLKKKKKKVRYGPGFEGPPPLSSLHHLNIQETGQTDRKRVAPQGKVVPSRSDLDTTKEVRNG